MKKPGTLFLLLLSVVCQGAFAGVAPPIIEAGGSSNNTQTKAYAGLAWTLGKKNSAATPDLVVGVRSVKVKSNDHINSGADLSLRFSFLDGFSFDSTRLSYVGGKRELLGNVGLGYSFANKAFLGTFAAQGAYSRAGLDYDFSSSKILPYLELLSVDKPKAAGSSLVCSDGGAITAPHPEIGRDCRPGG